MIGVNKVWSWVVIVAGLVACSEATDAPRRNEPPRPVSARVDDSVRGAAPGVAPQPDWELGAKASQVQARYTVDLQLELLQADVREATAVRAVLEHGLDGLWQTVDLTHNGQTVELPTVRSETALACLGLPTLLVELSGLDVEREAGGAHSRTIAFPVGVVWVTGRQELRWDDAAGQAQSRGRGSLPGGPFSLEVRSKARWGDTVGSLPGWLTLHVRSLASGGLGKDGRSEVHLELLVEQVAVQ